MLNISKINAELAVDFFISFVMTSFAHGRVGG